MKKVTQVAFTIFILLFFSIQLYLTLFGGFLWALYPAYSTPIRWPLWACWAIVEPFLTPDGVDAS